MKHPRLFIKTLCDLAKHPEILRAQVESPVRTAKVEAVMAQIALRVLAMMTDALGATGLWFKSEWRLLVSDQPRDHLALLVRKARRPGERLRDRAGKLSHSALGVLADGNDDVDRRQHGRCHVIRMNGHENCLAELARQHR